MDNSSNQLFETEQVIDKVDNPNNVDEECEDMDHDESFLSSQDEVSVGTALGKLLVSLDKSSKGVISEYDIRMTPQAREKHFQKFTVPKLEQCAVSLHIKIKSEEGKKLFRKGALVKKILTKVESFFPQYCTECKTDYAYELGDDPTHSCFKCGKHAHNCDAYQTMSSELCKKLPAGFIWLCGTCLNQTDRSGLEENNGEQKYNEPCILIEDEKLNKDVTDSKLKVKEKSASDKIDKILPANNKKNDKTENNPNNKPVCRYYLRRECKHGRRGVGCDFAHPNMCFKFIQRGERPGGCSKGKNCNYLHPPLCRGSKGDRMICTKPRCKFYHLKGVKITSGQKNPDKSDSSLEKNVSRDAKPSSLPKNAIHKQKLPNEPPITKFRNSLQQVNNEYLHSNNDNTHKKVPEGDFLELKGKIAAMSDQIQWMMQMMRMQNTGPMSYSHSLQRSLL